MYYAWYTKAIMGTVKYMRTITIIIGVLGLVAFSILLIRGSSIDYVATVDDEVAKLELDLAALDKASLSKAEAASARNKITSRLDTINASLAASKARELSPAQEQMLNDGLTDLQQVLLEYQSTLTALEETDGQEFSEPDSTTIEAIAQTIVDIQNYLDIPIHTGVFSHLDATYDIEGVLVTLVDGRAEEVVAGSAANKITQYFGNEIDVDLNNDERLDRVFLLTQSTSGTSTFFYIVAALNTETGWLGSEGFFLGDRIAPQTTQVSQNSSHQNVIVVNYLDRTADEEVSDQPSVGSSVWLKLDPQTLAWGEVEQYFAGETDPSRITLSMKPWEWIETTYSDGTELVPEKPESFIITFTDEGTFSVATDCNAVGGRYEVNEKQITFRDLMATEMFCTDSQELEFTQMLSEVQSYLFTEKGELVFELQSDTGSSVFK